MLTDSRVGGNAWLQCLCPEAPCCFVHENVPGNGENTRTCSQTRVHTGCESPLRRDGSGRMLGGGVEGRRAGSWRTPGCSCEGGHGQHVNCFHSRCPVGSGKASGRGWTCALGAARLGPRCACVNMFSFGAERTACGKGGGT